MATPEQFSSDRRINPVPTQPRVDDGLYTMESLSAKVGMSPRNIRAHQARRLLPPPLRRGRAAYYNFVHVRRLEAIKNLQRQGFNLVSIESMLGVRREEQTTSNLDSLMAALQADQPTTLYALGRHGIVGRADDGSVRVLRPRPLFAALELQKAGISPGLGLQLLTDLLDRTQNVGQHMVESTGARLLGLRRQRSGEGQRSWEDLDAEATMLTQALVSLLVEAFRTAVENRAKTGIVDMLAATGEQDFGVDTDVLIDNG